MNHFEITLIIVSVLSSFSSLLVMITFLFFPVLQNKLQMKLVFCISVSDFLANLGSSIGQPSDGSIGCWIQALTTTWFYTASIFWTTAVCYVLYLLVFTGTVSVSFYQMSLVCWLIPLAVTILPFVSATYGREPGQDMGWCYLKMPPDAPSWEITFWAFVTFYLWLGLSLILMFYWGIMIYYRVRITRSQLAPIIMKALNKLRLYPVVMVICWSVITVNQVVLAYISNINMNYGAMSYASFIPAVLQGMVVSIVFFLSNKDVQRLWFSVFFYTPIGFDMNSSMVDIGALQQANDVLPDIEINTVGIAASEVVDDRRTTTVDPLDHRGEEAFENEGEFRSTETRDSDYHFNPMRRQHW